MVGQRLIKNTSIEESYILLNKMILIFIILFFAYITFFHFFGFGFTCQNDIKPCKSCGLTRGLAQCIRFDFTKAQSFNSHSVPTFLFFCFQFISRILLLVFYKLKQNTQTKNFLVLDAFFTISCLLIYILFYG
jgi:hypothetical protein